MVQRKLEYGCYTLEHCLPVGSTIFDFATVDIKSKHATKFNFTRWCNQPFLYFRTYKTMIGDAVGHVLTEERVS